MNYPVDIGRIDVIYLLLIWLKGKVVATHKMQSINFVSQQSKQVVNITCICFLCWHPAGVNMKVTNGCENTVSGFVPVGFTRAFPALIQFLLGIWIHHNYNINSLFIYSYFYVFSVFWGLCCNCLPRYMFLFLCSLDVIVVVNYLYK